MQIYLSKPNLLRPCPPMKLLRNPFSPYSAILKQFQFLDSIPHCIKIEIQSFGSRFCFLLKVLKRVCQAGHWNRVFSVFALSKGVLSNTWRRKHVYIPTRCVSLHDGRRSPQYNTPSTASYRNVLFCRQCLCFQRQSFHSEFHSKTPCEFLLSP